jgi:hypothetical protein
MDMRMMFGLKGHVDDVNVIFGIDLWCFKVLFITDEWSEPAGQTEEPTDSS